MKKIKLTSLIIVIFLNTNLSKSQTNKGFGAKDYFKYEDYNRALIEYLKLYKTNKEDFDVNLKIGYCHLMINNDKSKAIPYLEFLYNKGEKKDDLILYLGMAYMYNYEFDKAIKLLNEYKDSSKKKYHNIANLYINNCESAKKLITKPLNVSFINLGKNINSAYPDYNPFVTRDQSTLFFTSHRITNSKKIQSSDGFYTSDIYYSTVSEGDWTKAKGIGSNINTAEDEQCVYVSPDGSSMIIYIDNEVVSGDLYISRTSKYNKFEKPTPFNAPINTDNIELEGCITSDANMVIVSSKRPEGFGETDLYMLKRLPNGKWGAPINLGPNINTEYKEAFPRFDEANDVLYFSSQGHENMGGFDIFKSQFNSENNTFEKAVNIGYPINTPEDNMQYSISGNKRDGYIAAYRKDGFGDLDIYNLIFNDVELKISVIKGVIKTAVTDSIKNEIVAVVTIFDKKTNKVIEAKNANKTSGKYVFAVEPGEYTLTVESPNFQPYSQNITIYSKSESDFVFEIEQNVLLRKFEAKKPTKKELD